MTLALVPLVFASAGTSNVEQARALLPAWVAWSCIVVFPLVTFLVTWVASEITALRCRRKYPDDLALHWTERARRLGATRIELTRTLLCATASMLTITLFATPKLLPFAQQVTFALGLVALLAGASIAWRDVARRFGRATSSGAAFALVFRVPLALFVALAVALPARPQGWALVATIGAALAVLVYTSGGSAWLVERLGLAHPLEHAAVQLPHETRRAGVFVVESRIANAIAFPFARRIYVTRRLMQVLHPVEIAAILRHEQGHLDERAGTLAWRFTTLVAIVLLACVRPLVGLGGGAGAGVLVVAVLWLGYAMFRPSTRAEEDADEVAVEGGDGAVYASALEKLHAENLTPAVLRRARTHPHLFDRMVAAGATPAWPRPEPPPRPSRASGIPAALLVVAAAAFAMTTEYIEPRTERGLRVALALGGATHLRLLALAELELDAHAPERAIVLARAAAELAPRSSGARAVTVTALVARGELAAANTEWETFKFVYDRHGPDRGCVVRWSRALRSLQDGELAPRGAQPHADVRH